MKNAPSIIEVTLTPSAVKAYYFIHESGHNLGLNDRVAGSWNYPSIMNYGYEEHLPSKNKSAGKDLWPDDLGNECFTNDDCTESICDIGIGRCVIDCANYDVSHNGIHTYSTYSRFSRGSDVYLYEYWMPSEYTTPKLTTEVYCGYNGGSGRDLLWPHCYSGSVCLVDWDVDHYDDTGDIYDLDINFNGIGYEYFEDLNDWSQMYNTGKNAFSNPLYSPGFLVFLSNLSSNNLWPTSYSDASAYDQDVTASGVTEEGQEIDLPSGKFARFYGPWSPGNITVNSSPSIQTMGTTVAGTPPSGFTIVVFFRVSGFPVGYGHQIVDSPLFQIDLLCSSKKVRGMINKGQVWDNVINPETIQANKWYKVVFTWNHSVARLYIIPWENGGWRPEQGYCKKKNMAKTTNIDPGNIIFGKYNANPYGWALLGDLDEPWLFNFDINVPEDELGCDW